jgi:hypothetical protein
MNPLHAPSALDSEREQAYRALSDNDLEPIRKPLAALALAAVSDGLRIGS